MGARLLETLGFEAHYEVDLPAGIGAAGVDYKFFKTSDAPTGDLTFHIDTQPLIVEVRPSLGEPWTGMFEGGPGGPSFLFATPSADVVCVVAGGQGFWVPVLSPARYEVIRSIPIKEVIPISSQRVVLFVDFTTLAAYGPEGFKWLTEDLSWDGLEITGVTPTAVEGLAWDSPAERRVPFRVDIQTGKAEGGSSLAKYRARRAH
jgi:hypothetical protein